jgi:hypothetical protein
MTIRPLIIQAAAVGAVFLAGCTPKGTGTSSGVRGDSSAVAPARTENTAPAAKPDGGAPDADPAQDLAPYPPPISSAVRAQALPPTSCEKLDFDAKGAWRPSMAEMKSFVKSLTQLCTYPKTQNPGLLACINEKKTPFVKVTFGKMFESGDVAPIACELSLDAAEWQGRHWIVGSVNMRELVTFFGASEVHEMRKEGPRLYLHAFSNDGHRKLCEEWTMLGVAKEDIPEGWAALPEPVQSILCHGRI